MSLPLPRRPGAPDEPITVHKITSSMLIHVPTFKADMDYEHGLAAAGHPGAMPAFILRQMDANARMLGIEVDHEHPRDATDEWIDNELLGVGSQPGEPVER